jgi:hypothetical protein
MELEENLTPQWSFGWSRSLLNDKAYVSMTTQLLSKWDVLMQVYLGICRINQKLLTQILIISEVGDFVWTRYHILGKWSFLQVYRGSGSLPAIFFLMVVATERKLCVSVMQLGVSEIFGALVEPDPASSHK